MRARKSLNSAVAASSRGASGASVASCFCSNAAFADALANAASAASSSPAPACSFPVCMQGSRKTWSTVSCCSRAQAQANTCEGLPWCAKHLEVEFEGDRLPASRQLGILCKA